MKLHYPSSLFYDRVEEELFERLSRDPEALLQFIRAHRDARANAVAASEK
jgi:hypothetical protein